MVEQSDRIDAGDIILGDLYNNYLFEIPNYQRPFSWEDEQFDELIDDLLSAYDRNIETYGDVENYLSEYSTLHVYKLPSEWRKRWSISSISPSRSRSGWSRTHENIL